jgi:hypothetical protein
MCRAIFPTTGKTKPSLDAGGVFSGNRQRQEEVKTINQMA